MAAQEDPMKLTDKQAEVVADKFPLVLLTSRDGPGVGKSTALIAKAMAAKHALVVIPHHANHWTFDDLFRATIKAAGEDWTYITSLRRWQKGEQTIDVVSLEDLKGLRGKSGYDVVCVDCLNLPDEAVRALKPGGQLLWAIPVDVSVHRLDIPNPYLVR